MCKLRKWALAGERLRVTSVIVETGLPGLACVPARRGATRSVLSAYSRRFAGAPGDDHVGGSDVVPAMCRRKRW